MISANSAVAGLLMGVDPALLTPRVNVMRLSLHPADWPRSLSIFPSGADVCSTGYGHRSKLPCRSVSKGLRHMKLLYVFRRMASAVKLAAP
jgi:hypothetical protein